MAKEKTPWLIITKNLNSTDEYWYTTYRVYLFKRRILWFEVRH